MKEKRASKGRVGTEEAMEGQRDEKGETDTKRKKGEKGECCCAEVMWDKERKSRQNE